MSFLVDVLQGALAQGTNASTLVLLNLSLLGCILLLSTLLFLPAALPSGLLPHIIFLLLLAVGLLASVNWLIGQTGTVSPAQQQRELFGDPAAGPAGAAAGAAQAEGAAGAAAGTSGTSGEVAVGSASDKDKEL